MKKDGSISVVGAGWFGFPLACELKKEGWIVKASTTNNEKFNELLERGIEPYLLSLSPVPENYDQELFNVEVLLVNIPPRNADNDPDFHLKQLRWIAARIVESQIRKVIFISSTAVYPNTNSLVRETDASFDTRSRGGVALMECEEIFRNLEGYEVVILRFGGLLGNGRHPVKYLSGKEITGADDPVNMIHLDDCLGVVKALLENPQISGTFNAVSNHTMSKRIFYEKAAEDLSLSPPIFIKGVSSFKEVSNEKLVIETGYEFIHNF